MLLKFETSREKFLPYWYSILHVVEGGRERGRERERERERARERGKIQYKSHTHIILIYNCYAKLESSCKT